ncbi:amine oxidase [copper-containing] [Biomphalaria glabrata]|nr:amine oxidase [copper-containing] [Biomphalaria glabrata]
MVNRAALAQRWFWPILAFIFAIFAVALALALIVVTKQRDDLRSGTTTTAASTSNDTAKVCGATNANGNTISLAEPSSPGPFHDLTSAEIKTLRTFLENHPDIRAAKAGAATLSSSYIFMMDLFLPKKADVLNYLNGTIATDLNRSARVIMFRGDKIPAVVEEWKCGPLQNIYSCQLLSSTETSTKNPVEFSLRPITELEIGSSGLKSLLKTIDSEIGTILQESYNATFTTCSQAKDCLTLYVSPVGSQLVNDVNQRNVWIFPTYNVPYYLLHPLGLGILCQLNGVDSTKWSHSKVWYSGQLYNSIGEFKTAYNSNSNGIIKIKLTRPAQTDTLFSTLNRRGDAQPVNPQRPPSSVEPDGIRYSLKNRRVTYLNWAFNFRMSSISGPALYDVRFKGERIAYEIALSEFAAFYSGNSPWPQTSDYVESASVAGLQYRSLVPGGDCPDTATLINQTFYNQYGDSPSVSYITFCLFEHNNGLPLRRHLSYTVREGSFYGGMLDSALVLRTALTVVNYDYIVDFIFHQNGVLETRLMASGYIQTSYYREAERPYGFRLGENILGNLHHHLVNFKIDLDIVGTSNRYQTLDIMQDLVKRSDDSTKDFYQNKIVRTLKNTEGEAVFDFNFDTPKQHIVFSNTAKNSFSESKGYRIHIEGMSKSLLPENVDNERSIPWARHQMVVTKQKDAEIRSSSVYGLFDSARPATNFTEFYSDNESILDQDLVFWVTCGTYHIPRTEDIPVTTTVGTNMGFYLLPYNYHNECPSLSSRDAIYVHHTDPSDLKKGVTVERYGNTATQCLTPKPTLESLLASNPDRILETNHGNYVY